LLAAPCITSCDGPVPEVIHGLSGTLTVTDFNVADGQSERVSGDITILASGAVRITGALEAVESNGQSITIQAEGDVSITGTVSAGGGALGDSGGNVTIVSMNGNISIGESASVVAGDGGGGQATTTAKTIVRTGKASVAFKTVSGGAGGTGGSVTLRAPNGEITVADVEGIIHLGNGGDGATIEVHGEDLLTTEMAEELENAGGDSGDLTIEALTFNGADISGDSAFVPTSGTFLSGGAGGNAGDFFWGQDAEGNSTYPDADTTAKVIAAAKQSGVNMRPVFPDLRRRGARGGNGIVGSAGNGAPLVVRGSHAGEPGTDGQNVFVVGGAGGDCKYLLCPYGGNGGKATSTGGNGARGVHPTGEGGKGGDADATGGAAGFGLLDNLDGFHGAASAFGGFGGKGGGLCPDNVADQGGPGGRGGAASAIADDEVPAFAHSGFGGEGGDGRERSGELGIGGNILLSGGPGSASLEGSAGISGAICPSAQTVIALVLASSTASLTVDLACVLNGTVAQPEANCDCEHVHGSIQFRSGTPLGGPIDDPNPQGCGHGCVIELPKDRVDATCD
jgi:hypothetical protein